MDSLSAFAMWQASIGQPLMVFDWLKAVEIIKNEDVRDAEAGLSGDWNWTGGPVLEDGAPVPQDRTYTYLASTWAAPTLRIIGPGYSRDVPCWRYQSDSPEQSWDAGTYWPDEAVRALGGDQGAA